MFRSCVVFNIRKQSHFCRIMQKVDRSVLATNVSSERNYLVLVALISKVVDKKLTRLSLAQSVNGQGHKANVCCSPVVEMYEMVAVVGQKKQYFKIRKLYPWKYNT